MGGTAAPTPLRPDPSVYASGGPGGRAFRDQLRSELAAMKVAQEPGMGMAGIAPGSVAGTPVGSPLSGWRAKLNR